MLFFLHIILIVKMYKYSWFDWHSEESEIMAKYQTQDVSTEYVNYNQNMIHTLRYLKRSSFNFTKARIMYRL